MENDNTAIKKDPASGKILLFVIGLLLGATIATVASFVCIKALGVGATSQQSQTQQAQQQGGTPPEMPSGENGGQQGGTPPEKPSDNNTQSN